MTVISSKAAAAWTVAAIAGPLVFGALSSVTNSGQVGPGFLAPAEPSYSAPAKPAPGVEAPVAPVAPVVPEAPVEAPDARPRTATDAVMKLAEENGAQNVVFFDLAGTPVLEVAIPGSAEIDAPIIVTRPGDEVAVEWVGGSMTLVFLKYDQKRGTYIFATE